MCERGHSNWNDHAILLIHHKLLISSEPLETEEAAQLNHSSGSDYVTRGGLDLKWALEWRWMCGWLLVDG